MAAIMTLIIGISDTTKAKARGGLAFLSTNSAAANTFWSAQSKEISDAKQEMMSSFDGLGKGFAGMLTPSGGASSGAVAGATLKSSV